MVKESESEWHLDKRVPIAMIFAFFIQSITFIWVGATWKADTDSRLNMLERGDQERRPQEARLIRLEERVISISTLLEKIDKRLSGENP